MRNCEATIGLDAGEHDPFPCELEDGHAGPHVFQSDQTAYPDAGPVSQKYKITWEETPIVDER